MMCGVPLMVCALSLCAPGAQDEPTFAQRLERLETRLDQRRQDLHIPGAALVVVSEDEVVLARGFGLRDLEEEKPATATTGWAIGSTSKAFTSMLIAMLVDDGVMSFEDPPSKWLPRFALADDSANDQVTLIDLLAHRTGLTRQSPLWYGASATRDQVIKRVKDADAWAPFRTQFLYNNVMYLAAGEASAAAAGVSWDELLNARLFEPLGMTTAVSSYAASLAHPEPALGYDWDATEESHTRAPLRNLDNCGPAGSIFASVTDMAPWIRMLLARGELDGTRLVSAEHFDVMWGEQNSVGSYGLGWFLQNWNDEPVVEHGGNIDGFAAQVGLFPGRDVGYALLTNISQSPLQQGSIALVADALFGPWSEEDDASPRLAEVGRESDPWGEMRMRSLTGPYELLGAGLGLELTVRDGRLHAQVEGQGPIPLRWPTTDGRWLLEGVPEAWVVFDEPEGSWIPGLALHQQGRVLRADHLDELEDLPITIDELMDLRRESLGLDTLEECASIRLEGVIEFEHAGLEGPFVWAAEGDQMCLFTDFGPHGSLRLEVDGDDASGHRSATGPMELDAADVESLQLFDPRVLLGDWRDFYEDVRIDKSEDVDGLEAIVTTLFTYEGERRTRLVSAEDGRLLVEPFSSDFVVLGGPMDMRFSDYREIDGVQVPHRISGATPNTGRVTWSVERVAFDEDLPTAIHRSWSDG